MRWAQNRAYLTASERQNVYLPGRNPFAAFAGSPSDPAFHGISMEGALVAIGHAMRLHKAPVAMLAMSTQRFEQGTKCSSSGLKKKCTSYVDGFASVKWYIGMPVEMLRRGITASICTHPDQTVCQTDTGPVASAGYSFEEWTGGNMPAMEDHLYHWETSKSSLTVMAFSIISAVVSFGMSLMLQPVMTAVAGQVMSTVGEGLISQAFQAIADAGSLEGAIANASGLSSGIWQPWSSALLNGAMYAASSSLQSGKDISAAQSGYNGNIGNGQFRSAGAESQHVAGLSNQIQSRHIEQRVEEGLTASATAFQGSCPASLSEEQCLASGLIAMGAVPRVDQYREQNTVVHMRSKFEDCKLAGYTGKELRKCAAPKPGAFSTPTDIYQNF